MLVEPIEDRYEIIIYNDDTTPFEFVIYVLDSIFNMTFAEAEKTALQIHIEKSIIFGDYSKEIAETKLYETRMISYENGFPDFKVEIRKKD